MRIIPTALDGPVLFAPDMHGDDRGFFLETFRASWLDEAGVGTDFVQDNHSRSSVGVIRGLHCQTQPGQAKLVRSARGTVWDVVVDLRAASSQFGHWEGFTLDDASAHVLFVPIGFAHGFAVLSDVADVVYKCSSYYDAATEVTIAHDDPDIGIEWPIAASGLSARDAAAPRLAEIRAALPW